MNITTATALVTGANRGLGHRLAEELLSRGTPAHAAARNPNEIDLKGAKLVQLDVTSSGSIATAAEIASDVTLLINNAGSSTGSDLLHGNLEQIRLEMDTHFYGTLAVIRAFAPTIAANGGGAILNILSALSWVSPPLRRLLRRQVGGMVHDKRAAPATHRPGIVVAGLHVGYMDTDMARGLEVPKADPAEIARIAIDGIERGLYEILADETARQVQAGLCGGVAALYPQLVAA